jgi:hypothetical protein
MVKSSVNNAKWMAVISGISLTPWLRSRPEPFS